MRSILTAVACVCVSAVLAADAAADLLVYTFSGSISASSLDPLPVGTSFAGMLRIDTSSVGVPVSPTETEFPQTAPWSFLSLNANGFQVDSTLPGTIVAGDFSPGVVRFTDTFLDTSAAGTGWSFAPGPGSVGPQAMFETFYFGTVPANLDGLPEFDSFANILTGVQLTFEPGVLTHPGGSVAIDAARVEFNITDIRLVPEPAAWLLGASALAALLVVRRKK